MRVGTQCLGAVNSRKRFAKGSLPGQLFGPYSARTRRGADSVTRLLIGVDHSKDSNAAVDVVLNRHWPEGTQVRLLAIVDTVMAVNPRSFSALGYEMDRGVRRRKLGQGAPDL